MERIQLPWMSERYLFLLSYCTSSPTPAKRESFVCRPSKLTNMVLLFCLPFPASDIYQSKGIHKLHFLPTCPVGHEAQRVRSYQDSNPGTLATFGVVEQNVLVPSLRDDPKLKVTAVASMFRRSPLCVASLGRGGGGRPSFLEDGDAIGAHEDTVNLLRRMFPRQEVMASPRGSKNTDLLDGKYAAIQAYSTTEVPALRRLMEGLGMDPSDLRVLPLEDVDAGHGIPNPRLGYSQVIFVADEALTLAEDGTSNAHTDRRDAARTFLDATFDGWQLAICDPDSAVRAVAEAQRMLKLDDESNDHWHDSASFLREMLDLVNDHVKEVSGRAGMQSSTIL